MICNFAHCQMSKFSPLLHFLFNGVKIRANCKPALRALITNVLEDDMSLKKTYSADGKKCTVVFNVNVNAAAGAEKIYLVGDFNSWDETSIPMKKGPDGSFSVKKQLDTNKEYQFRYLLDGRAWINDWKADKYVRSEFANDDNSCVDTTVPKAAKAAKKPAPKSATKTADKKPAAKKPAAKKTASSTTKKTAKK